MLNCCAPRKKRSEPYLSDDEGEPRSRQTGESATKESKGKESKAFTPDPQKMKKFKHKPADTSEWDKKVHAELVSQISPAQLFQAMTKAAVVMKQKAQLARERSSEKNLRMLETRERSKSRSQSLYVGPKRPTDTVVSGMKLLEQRLTHLNLKQIAMGDDGNCQFRSFSYQLYRTEDYHAYVRTCAVDHIKNNRDYYNMFFDGDNDFDDYCFSMGRKGTWGDEITLKAVCDFFGATIRVVQSTPENWLLEYTPDDQILDKELFVTYISPIHYNSIVHKEEE
eukprot:GFYU01010531.1.p1 GENE.GFYU01010531.1~~GFYU01010531.1.p1  ORF type:complete len:281 (+),score=57.63 GFYU01010531.1:84-926(+)